MDSKCLQDLVYKPMSGEWGDGEGGVSVIRTANFTNFGRINFDKVVTRNISDKKIQDKKLQFGDIIIEKSGGSPAQPVGRVVFFNKEGLYLCNNFTSVLRPRTEDVFPKYLHYILFCNHKFGFVRKFQNKTTGIINLQLPKYLKDTKIPLPPLTEQKKIAEILDAADSLRQKDQQLIEHYTSLSQSLFLDMFGDPVINSKNWDVVKLADVSEKITDGTHKTPKYVEKGVLFLSAKNIKENRLVLNNVKYITQGEHDQLCKRCKVERDDILITKSGSLGMAGMVGIDTVFSIFESLALIKYLRKKINGKFLLYFMNTSSTQYQYSRITKGVGVKHLHLTDLRKLDVISPPIELQNQFAERIEAIEKQKQQAQANLEKSEALFNSLLQRAFKGELTASKAA